jgi:Ca2+-transporting ATPase
VANPRRRTVIRPAQRDDGQGATNRVEITTLNNAFDRSGLSADEAASRLARDGPNALSAPVPPSLASRLVRQFVSPLIYVLLFALLFDAGVWVYDGMHGWPIEAIAIGAILFFNALLGVYQEHRSEAALARLRSLAAPHAWAIRDGRAVRIPSSEIVSGDLVLITAGDRIPADGTFADASGVMIDESLVTGESVPVDKQQGDAGLSGTLLVRGSTVLQVTKTGARSTMGRLAALLSAITPEPTPLERRVNILARQLARWVLMLAAAMATIGLIAEGASNAPQIIIFAVALAVAAVPEGLPAVLTVALSLGVERMARFRAVVRRLAAVEALGSVTVIATDKTGTLTQNRMDVHSIDSVDPERVLLAIVLANEADGESGVGDPLDLGLLRYAAGRGLNVAALRAGNRVVSERVFDAHLKFSRATVADADAVISYLKGAPEVLISRCRLTDAESRSWREKADAYGREGFRVLAVAAGAGDTEDKLTMLGLVLFWDPPRPEVPDAVRQARAAGIRVVMITGDHPATALAVAHQIGIAGIKVATGAELDDAAGPSEAGRLRDVNVFARVRPEQKLAIVRALQAQGHVVAVTGDGVNDAPALKQSDVGVAMGQRGSDVSREVADLVLLDDNFATIVRAIEEGRGIYENIQKFLRFLLSTNLSEVLLVAIAAVGAAALQLRGDDGALLVPLTAVQILWINLITDGVPSLALAFDRTPDVMRHRPRPLASPLLDAPSMQFVVGVGVMKAALALLLLAALPAFGLDVYVTRTVVFHFMALGQLLVVYAARHTHTHPLPNLYVHFAIGAGIVIQLAAASLASGRHILGISALPASGWAIVAGASLLALALAEVIARYAWSGAAATPLVEER